MNLEQLAKEQIKKTEEFILGYDWENPVAYAMWLAQTYYMVSHSTRLVALAGSFVPVGQESLHARFVDHSKEERGHQLVCLSDIKELGFKLEDFPKLYQSQAMYQIQYYWIQFRTASAFFGYTLSLECLAEQYGPQVASRVLNAHGKKASKFLLLHSEADQDHTKEAYEQIKNLSEHEELAAKENLILSCDIYRAMLIEAKALVKTMTHLQTKKLAG